MKLSFLLFVLLSAAISASAQEYGAVKATTRLRPDGTKITTIKDPEKRTWEETITDGGGKMLRKTTYLLDEREQAVEATFSDGKGTTLYKASYKRDGAGRVIEAAFTGADGRYLGKRVFIYEAGDVPRVENYDAQGVAISRGQAAAPPAAPATTSRRR